MRGAKSLAVLPHVRTQCEIAVGQAMQTGRAAQHGRFPAAGRPEQSRQAVHRHLEDGVEPESSELSAKARLDRAVLVHVPVRHKLFSNSIMVRMTRNENTSIPPDRMCAGVHCNAST